MRDVKGRIARWFRRLERHAGVLAEVARQCHERLEPPPPGETPPVIDPLLVGPLHFSALGLCEILKAHPNVAQSTAVNVAVLTFVPNGDGSEQVGFTVTCSNDAFMKRLKDWILPPREIDRLVRNAIHDRHRSAFRTREGKAIH